MQNCLLFVIVLSILHTAWRKLTKHWSISVALRLNRAGSWSHGSNITSRDVSQQREHVHEMERWCCMMYFLPLAVGGSAVTDILCFINLNYQHGLSYRSCDLVRWLWLVCIHAMYGCYICMCMLWWSFISVRVHYSDLHDALSVLGGIICYLINAMPEILWLVYTNDHLDATCTASMIQLTFMMRFLSFAEA